MTNEAEKLLLTHKEQFLWAILTSCDGMKPIPRVVHLCHNNELGFFISTRNSSAKVSQIEKNPFVAVSVYPGQGYESAVAHCTAQITAEQRVLDSAWSDDLKQVGYSGKTDPQLRVILFTLHSVTFGDKTYSGAPIDKAIYKKIAPQDVPALAIGPFQTKQVNELLKELFKTKMNAHLATLNGVGPEERFMETYYREDIGLYQITRINTQKVRQIHANSNVAVLLENKDKMEQVVVDAIGCVCASLDIKKKVWYEGLKQYDIQSPEDKDIVVLIFTPRKVVIHSMTTLPRVLLCDPLQYDKDIIILQNMSKLDIHFHLTSVDQEGVVHTRLMSKLHQHPTVGFSMSCRRFSNKISQLENNFNAALSTYNCETGDEYEIQALVVPQDTDSYRQATWVDYFLPIGYKDADDTSRVMLQVNVTKAVYVNVKEFWAQLKLSLESEHSVHSDK